MTRLPSGWFILPAIVLGAAIWVFLFSVAFASTGGGAEFSFTFLDFLKLHRDNIITILSCGLGAAIFVAIFGV